MLTRVPFETLEGGADWHSYRKIGLDELGRMAMLESFDRLQSALPQRYAGYVVVHRELPEIFPQDQPNFNEGPRGGDLAA